MIEVLAVMIIGLLAINVVIGYAILNAVRSGNTLTILAAQQRPGHRRSGVILRLPRINYGSGDDESLLDEA